MNVRNRVKYTWLFIEFSLDSQNIANTTLTAIKFFTAMKTQEAAA